MDRFPISRYLVPDTGPPALPAGFTAVRQALTGGLPQRIELGNGVHAMLVLPTGLARQWLDVDPLDLVSTSDDDLSSDPARPSSRPPLRLVVRRGTEILASVPLTAGLTRVCRSVELIVLSWHLCAGTVRGPGDYGSVVELGWRPADKAVDIFGPPVPHRAVLRRLPLIKKIESEFRLYREYRLLVNKKLRRLAK
jgi:hypothetical protein